MHHRKTKAVLIDGKGEPVRAEKIGRNDLCSCGSERKAKKCCGNKTKYFLPK